jgi:hypothetical protein
MVAAHTEVAMIAGALAALLTVPVFAAPDPAEVKAAMANRKICHSIEPLQFQQCWSLNATLGLCEPLEEPEFKSDGPRSLPTVELSITGPIAISPWTATFEAAAEATIARHIGSIRSCVAQWIVGERCAGGTVEVQFTVLESGRASSVVVASHEVGIPEIGVS